MNCTQDVPSVQSRTPLLPLLSVLLADPALATEPALAAEPALSAATAAGAGAGGPYHHVPFGVGVVPLVLVGDDDPPRLVHHAAFSLGVNRRAAEEGAAWLGATAGIRVRRGTRRGCGRRRAQVDVDRPGRGAIRVRSERRVVPRAGNLGPGGSVRTFVLRKLGWDLSTGLVFRPGVVIVLLAVAGWALPRAEAAWPSARLEDWLGAEPGAAQGVLGTVAGSMITVVSSAYSILLVALSLASIQFSTRIVIGYLRDRMSQYTLGACIGTFATRCWCSGR